MANTLMFQGVTAVALPLVAEFSISREIEDRVMAPVPVALGLPHMPLWAVYGLLVTALAVMLWIGLSKLKMRVLT